MATEVFNIEIKERLFFTILDSKPRKKSSSVHWLHTDDIYDYLYFPFAYDFGPPSIAQIYRFIKTVNTLLVAKEDKKIRFYSLTTNPRNTTNAVLLMGSYCIFSLDWTSANTEERFSALHEYLEFYRDASEGPVTYGLSVVACFRALEKAKHLGWINLESFNFEEYIFYEQVENGDFNWIIPNKFIAMCSPTSVARRTDTIVTHTPDYYVPYFQEHGVTAIVRLNSPEYDRECFLREGIEHYDMYFVDGTSPPLSIVEKFLEVVESASGVIAVHCKQGLGRTGSLIGCYIMKHYNFSAPETIAFLRIQRPGSVVGPQQHFMHKMEPILKSKAKAVTVTSPRNQSPNSKDLSIGSSIIPMRNQSPNCRDLSIGSAIIPMRNQSPNCRDLSIGSLNTTMRNRSPNGSSSTPMRNQSPNCRDLNTPVVTGLKKSTNSPTVKAS
jgi:cell division cycle 14